MGRCVNGRGFQQIEPLPRAHRFELPGFIRVAVTGMPNQRVQRDALPMQEAPGVIGKLGDVPLGAHWGPLMMSVHFCGAHPGAPVRIDTRIFWCDQHKRVITGE